MDERLKTIDCVIAENNKVSNKLNKKASEARQKMSLSDRRRRVDFNQALDARLINDDIAKMLVKVRWLDGYIRLGCDTPKQVEVCEDLIKRLFSFGYTGGFLLYTMLHGSLEECYNRVSHWRTKYASKVRCQAQPMLDFTKQRQDIPKWQQDMARWCNKRQIYGSCDFKDYEPRKGFRCEKYFE